MFDAPDPPVIQATSQNTAQIVNKVSNEESMEVIEMLYQLMAKQREYLQRQGAP